MLADFLTPVQGLVTSYFGPDLKAGLYRYQRPRSDAVLFWIPQKGTVAVMLGDDSIYPWAALPLEQENQNWSGLWIADVMPVVRPSAASSANWMGAGLGDLSVGSGKVHLGTLNEDRGYRQTRHVEVGEAPGQSSEHTVFRDWCLMAEDIHGKMQTLFERKAKDSTS